MYIQVWHAYFRVPSCVHPRTIPCTSAYDPRMSAYDLHTTAYNPRMTAYIAAYTAYTRLHPHTLPQDLSSLPTLLMVGIWLARAA